MNLDINSYYNIRNTLILTYMNNYVNTISKITSIMDKIVVDSRFDIGYTINDISSVGKEIRIKIIINDYKSSDSIYYKTEILNTFLTKFRHFVLKLLEKEITGNLGSSAYNAYNYIDSNKNIILPVDVFYLGNTIEIKL